MYAKFYFIEELMNIVENVKNLLKPGKAVDAFQKSFMLLVLLLQCFQTLVLSPSMFRWKKFMNECMKCMNA
jgi:hypothetical protein